jgi:hypothetical protein
VELKYAPITLSLKTRLAFIQHAITILYLLGLTGLQSTLQVARATDITDSNTAVRVGAVIDAVGQSSSLCLLEGE